MKIFPVLLLLLIPLPGITQNAFHPVNKETYLSSELINGRFYLNIPAGNGDTLLAFCDTGGGYTAIYRETVKQLNLETRIQEVDINGEVLHYILADDIIGNGEIPRPQIGNYYKSSIKSPFFEIPDAETDVFQQYVPHDVFLGQFFFMEHAWTFNYLTGQIFINTPLATASKEENTQKLGFKKDKAGNKTFGHPSMEIEVDGQILDVLFDTGASFLLADKGKKEFGLDKKSMCGSFIARSVFDRWHKQHPDWRIIEKGELNGADLIEVPQVKIGNLSAGPVWFSKRPDEVWSKGMRGTMDKVVRGAIGGSCLHYFIVTIDYNSDIIKFTK